MLEAVSVSMFLKRVPRSGNQAMSVRISKFSDGAAANLVCGCYSGSESIPDRQIISLPWFTVYECGECGLWYLGSLLETSAAEVLNKSHTSEEYLSAFGPGYLDCIPSGVEASMMIESITSARKLCPDASRLLDIGTGGGRFLDFINKRQEWEMLVGLDVSSHLAHRAGAKGLNAVVGDIQYSDGLRDGSFDVVTMWDVIEHLARPLKALRSTYRILSPRGVIVISTPNAGSVLHSLSLWMHSLDVDLFQKPAKRVFAGHPLYFRLPSLRRLLVRSGFTTRVSWQYGVANESSFRGGMMETLAKIVDASLGRILRRQYRMIIIAQKDEDAECRHKSLTS